MKIQPKDYIPPKSNSIYVYKCTNNERFTFKRYIEYFNDDKIQVIYDNGINSFINVYKYADDGIKLCYYTNISSYHQQFINDEDCTNNYLIKEPLCENNLWILSDGSKRCITNKNAKVRTHLSYYNSAIEVTTTSKNKSQFSVNYYVLGIGLVKSIYYIKNKGYFSFELDDILENTPYLKNINFYYPDKNLNTIWSYNKTITFNTNDNISLIFSKEFETPPKGLLSLIDKNTLINSLNYDSNFAYIDFSKDLLFHLKNSTKKYSNLFYHSIYNTLMNFYNTNDVCITINSIPYKNFFIISPLQQENSSIQNWMIKDCKYPFTYVVGENDTLIKISEKFNIPVLKLSKLNNIKNPNFINKDEVLQIYSNGIYSFKKNDSLNKIANMFGLSLEELIALNNITDLTHLKPGLKIKLC